MVDTWLPVIELFIVLCIIKIKKLEASEGENCGNEENQFAQ